MKVLITPRGFANYGLSQIEYMKSKGIDVHYNNTGKAYTKEEFEALAVDCDAIIVGVDIIDKTLIDKCPHLKVICKFGVGTDNIDLAYAEEKKIFVGRTIGSNSLAVAEHVMSLIYFEAKNLYATVKEVKEDGWNKPTGVELSGKSIGIVGFGAIGKHLAKIAKGSGMAVYVCDVIELSQETISEYGVYQSSFEEIITVCDYISLHLPLMEETRHMISTEEFKKMKKSSCLINAARGGIVDEDALYEALKNGEIRSACFDVFGTEPPSKGNKLLQLDNFYLTPHTAARTVESEIRTCEISTNIIMDKLIHSKQAD